MKTDLKISLADWQTDHAALTELRTRVFVDEQKVPVEMEIDDQDTRCRHFKVTDDNGRIVATARLLENAYIGRMCVDRSIRGQGIGAELLSFIIAHAERTGINELYLNAQVSAQDFYSRFGFIADSDVFLEAGIEHRHMTRKGQSI